MLKTGRTTMIWTEVIWNRSTGTNCSG